MPLNKVLLEPSYIHYYIQSVGNCSSTEKAKLSCWNWHLWPHMYEILCFTKSRIVTICPFTEKVYWPLLYALKQSLIYLSLGKKKKTTCCLTKTLIKKWVFKIFYLFIWLYWVIVLVCGFFSCGMRTLSWGMWDLVAWPGITPSSTVWSVSHWNTGEVPQNEILIVGGTNTLPRKEIGK